MSASQSSLSVLRQPNRVIWNSRAPYATFLPKHKRINRFYRVTRLAYRLAGHACSTLSPDDSVINATALFNNQRGKKDIKKLALVSERVSDLLYDLQSQYEVLDEYILIMNSSLFEAFTFCWYTNMLLATLENNKTLNKEQLNLVKCVGTGRFPQLSLRQVIDAFPNVLKEVEKVPRKLKDPKTRKEETLSRGSNYGALKVVLFWRNFRNLVVHSNRLVTEKFYNDNNDVWEVLRSDFRGIPLLRKNQPVPLDVVLVTASFTSHQVLAQKMRDVLIDFSSQRRGHVKAPGPFEGKLAPSDMPPSIPPIWLKGDW